MYVFRVDCMHFSLFLDTFGYIYICPLATIFLHKSVPCRSNQPQNLVGAAFGSWQPQNLAGHQPTFLAGNLDL